MPVPWEQTPTGTILVKEPETASQAVALYARVSSADQRADLDRQIARLVAYANERGWAVTKTVREIGHDVNGRRPKLMRLLADAKITRNRAERALEAVQCALSKRSASS